MSFRLIGSGRHPETQTPCDFIIPQHQLDEWEDDAAWRFEDVILIRLGVRDYLVAFKNLNRPDHDESFCLTYIPKRSPGERDPYPVASVFLMFVENHSEGMCVFDLGWRREDDFQISQGIRGFPQGWQDDFGGEVWRR